MITDRSEVVTKAIKSKSIARFDLAKVTSTGLFSMNKVLDQFCNSTSRTIYIKNHSGVIITIRPSALAQLSGSLSIVKRYSLDYNSAVVARNGLSNVEYDEDYFPGTGSSLSLIHI